MSCHLRALHPFERHHHGRGDYSGGHHVPCRERGGRPMRTLLGTSRSHLVSKSPFSGVIPVIDGLELEFGMVLPPGWSCSLRPGQNRRSFGPALPMRSIWWWPSRRERTWCVAGMYWDHWALLSSWNVVLYHYIGRILFVLTLLICKIYLV